MAPDTGIRDAVTGLYVREYFDDVIDRELERSRRHGTALSVVSVVLVNHGAEPFRIEPGMRIAQLVVAPVCKVHVEETGALDETSRGAGGYGSTGV